MDTHRTPKESRSQMAASMGMAMYLAMYACLAVMVACSYVGIIWGLFGAAAVVYLFIVLARKAPHREVPLCPEGLIIPVLPCRHCQQAIKRFGTVFMHIESGSAKCYPDRRHSSEATPLWSTMTYPQFCDFVQRRLL